MDLIICHQNADFDALGAAVGLTKLYTGAKILLVNGAHPSVTKFLSLHRDEFPLVEFRSVNPLFLRRLLVVDTQKPQRLGKAQEWLQLDNIESVVIYDHHEETEDLTPPLNNDKKTPIVVKYIEKVGACTTIICELLQQKSLSLNSIEATAMALGIHVDTGSLTFEQTTPRDASALAWLMSQGVNLKVLAEFVEPTIAPNLRKLLPSALKNLETITIHGYTIGWILVCTPHYIPGLSTFVSRIRDLSETDILLFAHYYGAKNGKPGKLTIIGRSSVESVNLGQIFLEFQGGGHKSAASLTIRCHNPKEILERVVYRVKKAIPTPLTAKDLMSYPVRTILPDTTIAEAQRILLRYGHSGLVVVDSQQQLVGIISRRDIDLALHHGFAHAPVKGYMTRNVHVIHPNTTLPEIEQLMVENDIGRLPVMEGGKLVGIVTRTDVLRHLHSCHPHLRPSHSPSNLPMVSCLLLSLANKLSPPLWRLLQAAAECAQQQGWHLYLVGGAVRDLLLSEDKEIVYLQDVDLVVDGYHQATTPAAGVHLAKALRKIYPQARMSVHGEFQTAALLWHKDPELGSLWVDIATARTEFYPYPAANPEVESSSIRQDLYRRDFTINALAVRLTSPNSGELLDFFGGVRDLRLRRIKVLHPNSFIEDPTRIYRAVRFAVRLNFTIEEETRRYMDYAIHCGVFERVSLENKPLPALTTRLRTELYYILSAPYWQSALRLLQEIGALRCIHRHCQLTPTVWWQLRFLERWLKLYQTLPPSTAVSPWLLRLEVILASFPEGVNVAESLQLPQDSIQRLRCLPADRETIHKILPTCERISEKVFCLDNYPPLTLILVALQSDKLIRRCIWDYLMHWRQRKPPLNGDDLKQLGYKPGKAFKKMLEEIRALFLDGLIHSRQEAIDYLLRKYPLP
ncbi:MAG: CBS domain-containing protein [Geminocystis sp.]|nr:CBS domain-containing protein [Geminocystis sp.]MCX8078488.1 CBS domain-containing protein [Geminocystis sp.]MDW8117223.1 CBS domain-containing protein [Geminocystis sp.]HIK38606.1 CBS domain-containing protein [Geminocystis sp. M7585_C2015_104]